MFSSSFLQDSPFGWWFEAFGLPTVLENESSTIHLLSDGKGGILASRFSTNFHIESKMRFVPYNDENCKVSVRESWAEMNRVYVYIYILELCIYIYITYITLYIYIYGILLYTKKHKPWKTYLTSVIARFFKWFFVVKAQWMKHWLGPSFMP